MADDQQSKDSIEIFIFLCYNKENLSETYESVLLWSLTKNYKNYESRRELRKKNLRSPFTCPELPFPNGSPAEDIPV